MFGSNDDKKTPAPAAEKKGLFGWLRKKPQETVAEQPHDEISAAPEPVIDQVPAAVEPSLAPQSVPDPAIEPISNHAVEAQPPVSPPPKPWLILPVAEESVALLDELEPHITPPIPLQSYSNVQPLPDQPLPEVIAEPVEGSKISWDAPSRLATCLPPMVCRCCVWVKRSTVSVNVVSMIPPGSLPVTAMGGLRF